MNYTRYTCERCLRIFDGDYRTKLCPSCEPPKQAVKLSKYERWAFNQWRCPN